GVYCTNPVTLKGTVVAGNYNIESGSEDEISIYRVLYNGGTGGSGLFTGSGDGTHTTTGSAAFIIGVPVSTDMASLNQLMATTDSNGNWVGKLADNGGSMQTIMPVAGQMDKVNASLFTTWGVTTDQIGATRPGSGYGTVGAVELHKSTVVTSSGDTPVSGLTTLRQALANVSDGGTVTFAPEVTTVTLTGSEIAFSQQDVTIDGLTNHSGSGVTVTRDITTTGGLLNSTATSGVLTLKSLTLTGGTSEDFGGALYCAGDASLISCTTSNNSAVRGGGLYVVGTATLEGCAISDNTADFGGGLYVVGSALLTACTLSGNAATGSNGGGICADGSVTLTNCTVSGNTAYNPGGGICANGSVTLTNCTVSGNSVSRSFTSGGGIFAGSVKLLGSVVAGNYNDGIASEITTGNTSYSGDGTLQIAGGADGTTASSAYYVVGAPAGGLDTLMQTTTVTLGSANCKVGLLAGNGGETQTIMPVAGSVLLDAIPASQTWLPTVDQRGKDRPAVAGGPATIGAVEPTCALAPVITTQPSGLSLVYGQSASALSVVVATPADGGQLSYQWYSSATSSLTSPTQISGATSSAYTPATTAVATTYYYCVITNTTTDLDINMAQTTSDAAEVIVDKASQSISLEGLGSTYTYGASSFTVSVTGGLGTGNVTYASSDTSVASVVNNANNTATITILKAGQFSITADKVADSAYNAATVTSGMVTVDEAMPTVTLTSADVSAGSDVVLNVTVASSAGAIPTGTVTFYEGTTMLAQNVSLVNGQASYTVTTPDAGNHDYTVDYSGLTGYYRPASSDTCTVGVNKIDQSTLTFVDPGTKVYGEGDFTLSTTGGSGTGAVSFKVPDDSVISISGNTATIHGAGTVVITATKAGDNIYNDAQATFTLTVNPRDISNVTVKVTGPAVYTGSQLQPNFSVSDGTIAIGAGDYYAGAYGANVNVVDGGSFVVYGQGNYTGQKLVNFNIAPKPIAVTADNQQKCFEDGDPTLSWTAPGLVKGDHPTGALTYTGWAIGHYDITQGSLNFGPNYTVAFTKGTMTITNTPAMDKAISAIDHLAKPIRSKADADAVAEATRDYGALSADEKGQIAASVKSKLKTAQGQAATVNHTDGEFTATGASLLWNIRLVVTPVAKSDSRYAAFARKVSGKKIAALYDIKLIDTLTGKTYEPPHGQTITVTLSNAALAAIKGASIAHEKTGGAIEYLPATRKGNKLSFTATSFSLYGVVSNKGSGSGSGALDLSGLSTGDRSNQVLFTAVLLILAAALAIVALDPRRRKAASEVAAAAAAAAASEDASEDASATASESATGSSSSD
ncbi:MAG: Ig-like domain repeat protein, partial [Coriobacteriia bacterium]|nr:Ig-like domain repeat protein [Coriobacteriia bacterium]